MIIKPERDVDRYIEWSTIVEAPITWGTREEIIAGAAEDAIFGGEPIERRIERADATSSSHRIERTTWDEDTEFDYILVGYILRSDLPKLLDILESDLTMPDDDPRIMELVHPHEEED